MRFILSLLLAISCAVCSAQDLRYKVGQMLVVGFKGTLLDEQTVLLLSRHYVGGVILFDKDVGNGMGERNIRDSSQLKKLTLQMHRLRPDLLICIDQEGGSVARLKPAKGFERSVSAQYLGKINNPDTTMYYSRLAAAQLRRMGVNVNFSPCVDLNINPSNPIIGKIGRSFSDNPKVVTDNALIVINEHHKQKILTSLKHFPGHGSSTDDSHAGFTDITNTFRQTELEPYKAIINENKADIIMVGHLFNSNIDSKYPASLSQPTIDSLLRGVLGFKGVVATDDMNMRAITDNYPYHEALERAINAGVDMVIIGNNATEYVPELPVKTINIIMKLVAEGKIPEARINQAYDRIQQLKKSIL